MIASKIITRQAEAGAPVGVLPSGGVNISEIMEMIRVEEIISALQTDAKIDVAIAPGITLTAQGANGGGPVVCLGQTIGIGSGNGIIR
jgi:precorrin-3B methylase